MKGWFSKNLGDGLIAQELVDDIEIRFTDKYVIVGKPDDMATFIRHESEGRLHCEVIVYFSPASALVARDVDAKPCLRPSPSNLALLTGSEASWLILFPECSR